MNLLRILLPLFVMINIGAYSQTNYWELFINGNKINTIDIDFGNGKVWAGTQAGIAIVDMNGGETEFISKIVSTAPHWEVEQILRLNGSITWALYYFDLGKYENGNWTFYNSSNSQLPSQATKIVAEGDSVLWIGSLHGLARFDGTNWELFNTSNSFPIEGIYDIVIDSQNNKWISGWGGLVKLLPDNSWQLFTYGNFVRYSALAIDSQDHVWMCASDTMGNSKALMKFDGTDWTDHSAGLWTTSILKIAIDSMDNKWIGSIYGLTKMTDSTIFNFDSSPLGPVHERITDIKIDEANKKWIATEYGLLSFDDTNWTRHNTSIAGDMNNYVLDIMFKNDTAYIGTADGIYLNYDDTIVPFNMLLDGTYMGPTHITSMAYDYNDTLWVGTESRLFKLRDTTWHVYSYYNSYLPFGGDVYVWGLAIDNANKAWIGVTKKWSTSQGGVVVLDGNNTTFLDGTLGQFPAVSGSKIITDNAGNLWFATRGAGLVKHFGSTWVTYNTSNSGIPSNTITDIVFSEKDSSIWLTTIINSGITNFNGTDWITYTTANSNAPSDEIEWLAIDTNSNIWMTTDVGISMFDGVNWFNYDYGSTHLIYSIQYCLAIDENNVKWIGTELGYAKFNENASINIPEIDKPSTRVFIEIYPNPSQGRIWVSVPNISPALLTLYDISGRQIFERQVLSLENPVNLDDIHDGIYILVIHQNEFTVAKKLIIRRD